MGGNRMKIIYAVKFEHMMQDLACWEEEYHFADESVARRVIADRPYFTRATLTIIAAAETFPAEALVTAARACAHASV